MAFQGDELAQAIEESKQLYLEEQAIETAIEASKQLALEKQAIETAIEESKQLALEKQVARDADVARSLQADPWSVVDAVHPDVQVVPEQVAAFERSRREKEDRDFDKALALQNQQFPPFLQGYEEKEEKEGKAGEEDDFANQCAITAVAKATGRSRLQVLNDLKGLGDESINAQIRSGNPVKWRAIGLLARKYNICVVMWFDLGGAHYIHRKCGSGEGVQTFYINANLSGVTLADMKREWQSVELHFEYLTPPGTYHGNPGTPEVDMITLLNKYSWCKILNYA